MEAVWINFGLETEVEKNAGKGHAQDLSLGPASPLKEKNLRQDEKAERLKYFHRDTARKEISAACNECHSEKGILDFQKLGFDNNKTKILNCVITKNGIYLFYCTINYLYIIYIIITIEV